MADTDEQIAALTARVAALESALQVVADLLEDTLASAGDVARVEAAGIALAPIRRLAAT